MAANDNNGQYSQHVGSSRLLFQNLAHILIFQGVKVLSFILGFFLTFGLLTLFYAELALTKLFKGISVQNFIDIILEVNIAELTVIFYFIGLFIFFFVLNRSIKKFKPFSQLSPLQESTISGMIVYFREGILTLPFIIMIVFPMLLQVILPILIFFVAFVEVVFPFAIMGELYSISKGSFSKLVHSEGGPLQNIAGILLAYPLGVYILVLSGLDKFLNLVHFHIVWDNPQSGIATTLWSRIDQLIEFLSLGNSDLSLILSTSKYFVVTLLVLVLTSELYLILKKLIQTHGTPRLTALFLTYD